MEAWLAMPWVEAYQLKVSAARAMLVGFAAVAGLAGCGNSSEPAELSDAARAERGAAQAGYLTPPSPDAVRLSAAGVVLSGAAQAGGKVRLATPAGAFQETVTGRDGRWTLALAPMSQPAIYGLSVETKGQRVQAEGYLLVTPGGQAAVLRSGAAALRIDAAGKPALRAIDFDREGGAVISAWAPAGAVVALRVDGRPATQGRADQQGRYEAPLQGALQGSHRLEMSAEGYNDAVALQITRAQPLAPGPMRAQNTGAGLRVDWTTPGGGVQSTILVH